MKKLIPIPISILLVLSACQTPQERAHLYTKVCIDSVQYLLMPNAYGDTLVPHMKIDGIIHSCDE